MNYQEIVAVHSRQETCQLVAMVLCSTEDFISVCICLDDVNCSDFLWFLQESIQLLDTRLTYRIVADNPQWHKGPLIEASAAGQLLLYNIPGVF